MQCGSCGEEIPSDSIFCPECGSRQDLSKAGGFTAPNTVGLSGQEVSGGRNFGVVSGEAIRKQREMSVSDPSSISPELLQQIAQGMQNQQNIPPIGNFPPQSLQNNQVNQNFTPNNMLNNVPNNQNVISNNQSSSPTDEMVNRLAEAEKAMKSERRSQWLNMNQTSASNVLSSLGADLPGHLKNEKNAAQEILSGALGAQKEAPNDAFLRRMCEVAVRRVARKRGVAVETPQAKLEDEILRVNITYIDDGRVLDSPDDLSHAFEHAIQTEVALKGFEYLVEINLYRSKDGQIENLSEDEEDEEEMFACEICDGLVKESDNECPHCGAIFEDEEDEPMPSRTPPRGGPPGGPSRGGMPRGPSSSPPNSPRRSGPPGGPSRKGPPPKSSGRKPPTSGPIKGPSKPPSNSPNGRPRGPSRSPPSGGPSAGPPKGPRRGPPK